MTLLAFDVLILKDAAKSTQEEIKVISILGGKGQGGRPAVLKRMMKSGRFDPEQFGPNNFLLDKFRKDNQYNPLYSFCESKAYTMVSRISLALGIICIVASVAQGIMGSLFKLVTTGQFLIEDISGVYAYAFLWTGVAMSLIYSFCLFSRRRLHKKFGNFVDSIQDLPEVLDKSLHDIIEMAEKKPDQLEADARSVVLEAFYEAHKIQGDNEDYYGWALGLLSKCKSAGLLSGVDRNDLNREALAKLSAMNQSQTPMIVSSTHRAAGAGAP